MGQDFGTLCHEIPGVKPVYGLSREVKRLSFSDMYLGEIGLLIRDVRNAPSFKVALMHIVMPPGWKPGKSSGLKAVFRVTSDKNGR